MLSVRRKMTATIPDRHPFIVDLLKLLASEEEQLAYARNVPHLDITAELVCMWFNDLYCPDDAFFRSCFSDGELEALADFHEFYDQRVKLLPESRGTVQTWLASPMWRQIMLE